MRGVDPPVVALLLAVLALPLLVVAAAASAYAGDVPGRPAAPASVSASDPPARATTLPGAENDPRWYNTDAILELGVTVLATGAVAIVVLRRLP
jgi:hypothetical protein